MNTNEVLNKLIAEIKMRIINGQDGYGGNLKALIPFITSLQQEQPKVDLDREIIKYKVPFADDREYLNETTLDAIAHHFYGLGLNAKREE